MEDCFGSGYGTVEGYYEYSNEPPGSIKDEQLIDYLCDYKLLRKDSSSWTLS
jgi:hypothetical protein